MLRLYQIINENLLFILLLIKKINNYKLNNFNNAQNIQYQQVNSQPVFFQKKSNSLLYSLRNSNDINYPITIISKNNNLY